MHCVPRKKSGRCFLFPFHSLQKFNSFTRSVSYSTYMSTQRGQTDTRWSGISTSPSCKERNFLGRKLLPAWREETDSGDDWCVTSDPSHYFGFSLDMCLCVSQSQKGKSGLGYFLRIPHLTVCNLLILWLLFLHISPKLSERF